MEQVEASILSGGAAAGLGGLIAEPLVWVALWVIVAAAASARPSPRRHWPLAVTLLAVGVPLAAWCFAARGPLAGTVALVVGAMVLRWPLRHGLQRAGDLLRAGRRGGQA